MLEAAAAAAHARIGVHADITIADDRRALGAIARRLLHAEIGFVETRAQREIFTDDGEVIELGERHAAVSRTDFSDACRLSVRTGRPATRAAGDVDYSLNTRFAFKW